MRRPWFAGARTARALMALIVVAAALAGGPAAAASDKPTAEKPGQRLEEVNRALDEGRRKARALKKEAQQIQEELNRLRRDMVAAAHIIQEQEKRAGVLVKALAEMKAKEDAKLARLTARRGQLAGVLVALQRVARYPPEALITQPMPPADTVRSAILLRAAVPEIEHRAAQLRDDLETLAAARREISEKRAQFVEVTAGLERERQRLATLYGQKTALKHRTLAQQRAAARRVKSLAGEAASLRELLDRVGKSRPSPRPMRLAPGPDAQGDVVGLPDGLTGTPITAQRGKLPPPAVGRIVGRYGQNAGGGLTRKGMTLETAAGAQVVAPYEGRVVFAGEFRGYGELLIIEHGEGYHSLLAGLARIDSTMGQWVVAGEPVGVMGRPDGQKPVLYVELRRNGQPINPLPWLAAQR
ncbi:MAG: murein hydrolase activator EnvC family protein [Rhodospirillales bacterium]